MLKAALVGCVGSTALAAEMIARSADWSLELIVTLELEAAGRHSDFVDLNDIASAAGAGVKGFPAEVSQRRVLGGDAVSEQLGLLHAQGDRAGVSEPTQGRLPAGRVDRLEQLAPPLRASRGAPFPMGSSGRSCSSESRAGRRQQVSEAERGWAWDCGLANPSRRWRPARRPCR